jgi:membrane-associated phospholipid phosphatase
MADIFYVRFTCPQISCIIYRFAFKDNQRRGILYKIILIFSLVAVLSVDGVPNVAYAQDKTLSDNKKVSLNSEYFKGYISDTKHIVTSPSRWDKKNWLKASLVVGVTIGLYAFDEDIRDWVQDNRHDDLSEFAERFGDGKLVLPPLVLFYAVGHAAKNVKAQRTALLTLENVVITGIFTQLMKYSFQRHRPKTGDPFDSFDGPFGGGDNLAFPSGHTSLAFSIATPIATEYKDNILVPPVAYGLASLVAWSRVNDNKHWASDVFMGASLGYFTGKAICRLHEDTENSKVTVMPVMGTQHSGVMISYAF